MAKDFNLPDIGSGLQEAEIVNWLVKVGDVVTTDQVLCEVETEKSLVEIPVPHPGVVLKLAGPPGTSVKVGELLVVIGEPGETLDDGSAAGAPAAVEPEPMAESMGAVPAPAASELQPAAAPIVASPVVGTVASARPHAMPLVRKIARDHGIDLATVVGTGLGGRITRSDVEAVAATPGAAAPVAATPPVRVPESGSRAVERRPLPKLRRTIGAHMTGQWQSVPHITAHVEADATRFLSMHKSLAERLGKKVPMDALLTAMIIPALRQFPEANAQIDGDELVIKHYYDVGIAVGSADGLLVPVVRNADRLSLPELVDVVADLAARAKDRKVSPDEMGEQTFTISNLGGLRGRHATQVIPAGTSGIVSIGRSRPEAVVRDGEIVVAPVMPVSGTFDHRVMDGVEVMGVLNAFVDIIEEPTLLLV
jgi:pyruvate dehydrogenase E2 component (dihydrolipoamide acetyltransferase)